MDVVQCIKEFNAGRDPERLALKYAKMRVAPFIFLRGSCHLFYQHLPLTGSFRKAPLAWVCGDLHLENFGSYKGDNRLSYFDINDFDEAAMAPCTWDIVRLLVSVLLGMPKLGVPPRAATALCQTLIAAYADALAKGKARWVERDTGLGLVGELLDGVRRRARPAFLDTRSVCVARRRQIRLDNNKALPVSDVQRERIGSFLEQFAAQQENPGFYKLRDMGRRIAGTGSLGVERYILLIEGRGSPDGNFLLDLKEALPSALAPRLSNVQPKWKNEASRVVSVQQRLQAVSMAFLQAVNIGRKSYVLRSLQPSEDRVALGQWNNKLGRLEIVMRTMAEVTAWAHLRGSGHRGADVADTLSEFALGQHWRNELLEAAIRLAEQTETDWGEYVAAYDDGVFVIG